MRLDLNALPTDPVLLHRMVRELVDALDTERADREKLERRVAWLTRQHFGTRSEQVPQAQLRLWLEALEEDEGAREAPSDNSEEPAEAGSASEPKRPVRKPLPASLPRTERTLEPDSTCCAECGERMHRIGEEQSEQLDYRPASFFVRRTIRPKYACRGCETVVTAPMPAQPIAKGNPAPGLLAHVLVSKYADHQPLYRQTQIAARHEVTLPTATLAGWVGRSATVLSPLVDWLKADVLSDTRLHTDDTTVPVLEPGRGTTKTGRLWVYVRAHGPDPPAAVYDYTPTRKQSGPQSFLEGYRGYLHADAYPGYQSLYASGQVQEVACWMHARRHFFEIARKGNAPRAAQALAWIKRLYEVEEALSDTDAQSRRVYRDAHARPVLEDFNSWLQTEVRRLPPKGALAQAMRYVLVRWPAFTRYLDDGDLAIDNGAAERAVRGPVLGRKNYLFAGSDAGGQRAAVIYSLIETCKLNTIEPFAYLRDVLARIADQPSDKLAELLPYRWAPIALPTHEVSGCAA